MPSAHCHRRGKFRVRLLLCGAAVSALSATAHSVRAAEDPWALCPPSTMPAPLEREAAPEADESTILNADRALSEGAEVAIFEGNVEILRSGRRLLADRARYDQAEDTVEASGNVSYQGEEAVFEAERAQINLGRDTGKLEGTRYHIFGAHAFGEAGLVQFEGDQRTRLEGATYSTCPPEKPDWQLRASRLNLDRGDNTGEAYHVTMAFKGVPFMYVPYMNFPLEGRKSGLLAPTYGNSDRAGAQLAVPYYWNIAPDRDATITPRFIEKRGTMAETEFRYLNRHSRGQIGYDFLQNDKLYREELRAADSVDGINPDDNDRYYLTLNHRHQLSPRWSADLNYQEVSDNRYFEDFKGTLSSTSVTHLERRLDLNYRAGSVALTGRAQDFQPIVEGREPYQRLPQLLLSATPPQQPGQLNYDFNGEFVTFEHDTLSPTGSRLDLHPSLSYPLEGRAWFINPRAGLRYTEYDLEYAPSDGAPGGQTRPNRSVPTYSLDAGLFFEREIRLAGTPLIQTLEPRLYYLYVPYEAQDELPVFDTSEMTFSFTQLFRPNRFNGADRVGDANQLTTAVTTRFLHGRTGRELGHGSIGQITYFRDRRVTLDGPDNERTGSDIVGELAASPLPSLSLSASGRWNPEENFGEEWAARMRYAPDTRRELSAAYRLTHAGAVSNTDLLARWPLTRRWQVLGRWYYDRVEERSLETVVGLEYETCCWTVRLAGRSRPFINVDNEIESDRTYFLMLELKGLGNIGPGLDTMISEGILGYD